MKKIILALILLLLLGTQTTGADEPNDSEKSINATSRLSASTVKITTTDGVGAGFFIAPHSVITNEHVAHIAVIGAKISVSLKNKQPCSGIVAFKSEPLDLALITTSCTGKPLTLSPSAHEGESVVAIGHPLGYDWTASRGIVSNLEYRGWVQFDASVDHGNSGGVLGNLNGEVVGLVTRRSKEVNNIGFALNTTIIQQFLDFVRQTQTIE